LQPFFGGVRVAVFLNADEADKAEKAGYGIDLDRKEITSERSTNPPILIRANPPHPFHPLSKNALTTPHLEIALKNNGNVARD
jgi:hypothetical protein